MKKMYQGKSRKGGVYRILNTKNGRSYIGSTYLFKVRWNRHEKDLSSGNHHCKFLQRDFNKCGEDAFVFEVLEVIDAINDNKKQAKEKRYDAEQRLINETKEKFGRDKVYNGYLGIRRREYKPQPEKRKKLMSEKMKELYSDPKRKAEASKHAQKRWSKHSADITVVNKKTGETVTINQSVRSWCEDRGLSYKAFHLMIQGKTKSNGGWKLLKG